MMEHVRQIKSGLMFLQLKSNSGGFKLSRSPEDLSQPHLIKVVTVRCSGEVRSKYTMSNFDGFKLQQKWIVNRHYSDGSYKLGSEWRDVPKVDVGEGEDG